MKPTKKQIQEILKRGIRTEIFKVAALSGIDMSNRHNVFLFVQNNAKTKSVYESAYHIAYGYISASEKCRLANNNGDGWNERLRVIDYAKHQKKSGYSNYSKILLEGNTHIWWVSPVYKFRDYNKGIAMDNNSKNRKLMEVVNKFLGYKNEN